MPDLSYLRGYPDHLIAQAQQLLDQNRLGSLLLKKYPQVHEIRTDKALYHYTLELKNRYLRKSQPLSKVIFDDRIDTIHQALGLHAYVSRVQGGKLKTKNEIRVASLFKQAPSEFLRMIVVHELAHLREKEHNKAFYKLCHYMEPDYHQLELDLRLYLCHLERFGSLYT